MQCPLRDTFASSQLVKACSVQSIARQIAGLTAALKLHRMASAVIMLFRGALRLEVSAVIWGLSSQLTPWLTYHYLRSGQSATTRGDDSPRKFSISEANGGHKGMRNVLANRYFRLCITPAFSLSGFLNPVNAAWPSHALWRSSPVFS